MSTELKLLRSIVAMEAQSTDAPNLSTLRATAGVPVDEFREHMTRLFRKGYVSPDWRTTPAGKRVASRALGQVLLRRQPRGHQEEHGRNAKTKARKVFPSNQPQMPPPLMDLSLGRPRSHRNTPAKIPRLPPQMLRGQQHTPPPLPCFHGSDETEPVALVRDSELEELKPPA